MAKSKINADPNLGRNLRFLMDQSIDLKGQTQVAARTGLSQSSVGRILRGEVNPSAAALNRIAEEFKVEIGDLYLPHKVFAEKHPDPDHAGTKSLMDAVDKFTTAASRIAKGMVPLSTWKKVANDQWTEEDEWVICPVPHSDSSYALEVKGLGMFDPSGLLSFREKDRIFVDQRLQPAHRSLVIVRIGDSEEAVFRQLLAEDGQWLLVQLNPSFPNRVTPLAKTDKLLGIVTAKLESFV